MKRYIVCVPQKWEARQVSIPYSVQAETPLSAARSLFAEKPNLSRDTNGEVCVVEAKAGRLDDWHNFYSVEKITGKKS